MTFRAHRRGNDTFHAPSAHPVRHHVAISSGLYQYSRRADSLRLCFHCSSLSLSLSFSHFLRPRVNSSAAQYLLVPPSPRRRLIGNSPLLSLLFNICPSTIDSSLLTSSSPCSSLSTLASLCCCSPGRLACPSSSEIFPRSASAINPERVRTWLREICEQSMSTFALVVVLCRCVVAGVLLLCGCSVS